MQPRARMHNIRPKLESSTGCKGHLKQYQNQSTAWKSLQNWERPTECLSLALSLCVHLYICIYACIHVCVLHMCVCMYVCMCVCMYVCMHLHIYLSIFLKRIASNRHCPTQAKTLQRDPTRAEAHGTTPGKLVVQGLGFRMI